jgi:RimJ/RimL family protein N-acetyltransferase
MKKKVMLKYILREMNSDDQKFIYELQEEYLKTNLSVTILILKPFEEFFKSYILMDLKTYIILVDNERIGFVHITKEGEIGYFLTKKYEGKGIASNAVKDMLKLHPLKRYFATVNINNTRSTELVKGLGFSPKGIIYEKITNN